MFLFTFTKEEVTQTREHHRKEGGERKKERKMKGGVCGVLLYYTI